MRGGRFGLTIAFPLYLAIDALTRIDYESVIPLAVVGRTGWLAATYVDALVKLEPRRSCQSKRNSFYVYVSHSLS